MLLSRSAENLYWANRYVERAETISRLLDVGYRISLLPNYSSTHKNEWESILLSAGSFDGYRLKYNEFNQKNISDYLLFDNENKSSVINCMKAARNNIRSARTRVTNDVWLSFNQSYKTFQKYKKKAYKTENLPVLCNSIKQETNLLRGAIENTQLENDGFAFLNLGYFIERANSTARLLDIKYFVLLPKKETVGGELDKTQWDLLLRALSAHRAFSWAYDGEQTPEKIVHFLILHPEFPRSLIYSLKKISLNLEKLKLLYGEKSSSANLKIRNILSKFYDLETNEIFKDGLHEFLTNFIISINEVSESIEETYFKGIK